MTLGERIRHRRTELGLTQAQVGVRAGWPDSRVGAYERDEICPSIVSLQKLAKVLDMSIYDFEGGELDDGAKDL